MAHTEERTVGTAGKLGAERRAEAVWAGKLIVKATCAFEQVPTGFAITTIALDVHGRVPGIDDQHFEQAAQRAARICPVSKALNGNVDVRLNARLEP